MSRTEETNSGSSESESKKSMRESSLRVRLFIAGEEPNSVRAREALTILWEKYLKDQGELEIIDVFKDYSSTIENHIIAVPALLVERHGTRSVLVGSVEDEDKVLRFLGIGRERK